MSLSKTTRETAAWFAGALQLTWIATSVAGAIALGVEYGMERTAACLVEENTDVPVEQKVDQCTFGPFDWVMSFGRN